MYEASKKNIQGHTYKKSGKKKNHKQNPGNKKPNRLFNLERKEKKLRNFWVKLKT